ncbi:CP2A9 protein, partial [Polypterus senegalus]|nr:CP2A9 protein [Polypterus senegalus]
MQLFWTLVLSAIVLGLLLLLFQEHSSRYTKMPPGPTPLPLIGNMLQLNSKALHESFMELKEKFGPVMTVHLGPIPLVVLVGFEAVHEALVQQADTFAGREKVTMSPEGKVYIMATFQVIKKVYFGTGEINETFDIHVDYPCAIRVAVRIRNRYC